MNRLGKTRVFLTEFIIVILFFSIAAVTTLQLFLAAHAKSIESSDRNFAVIKLQTIAEEAKNSGEYVDSFFSAANGWTLGVRYYDADWKVCGETEAVYSMTVNCEHEQQEAGELVTIELTAERLGEAEGQEEELGSLTIENYLPDREDEL